MSWNPALEPGCPDLVGNDAIETLIIPRSRDIGGFEVRRALPAPKRQMVGPFIFFDEMGPAEFLTGQGIDVRPHPHIGLGTVTYLFQGDFHHRDSIGTDQVITPGAVNWMVAGKGVSHSERTSAQSRSGPSSLFGIQTWVALPERDEDRTPTFEHHGKETLPVISGDGIDMRLIMGRAYGEAAPVSTFTDMFYGDVTLAPNARMPLPDDHEDRGIYVIDGAVTVAGDVFDKGRMMIFRPGDKITIGAGAQGARLVMLGGETLGGPRYIWWNFVASSRDKIEAAKEEWQAARWGEGLFDLPINDKDEFIPLPEKLRLKPEVRRKED
ncbi:pirin family protein [Qingshengfaniella alkalisoli]|uniref:Pirin family protein n=1 Tax=Qingshengfaniella alkalisoli TaxID=2599296 RepID=A0A5B8IUX0_9RHOB|nr:pirin family protein [Qingshengfaniella alkalisoli]QDY69233.1 pirin family protein [Qingshengfaniella alkalisoli]